LTEGPTSRNNSSETPFVDDTSSSAHSLAEIRQQLSALRVEIDELRLESPRTGAPWYRQVPVLISIIALLLSTVTSLYAINLTDKQSDVASRAELGQLIQRLTALPKENTDLTAKYANDPGRSAYLGGLINEENLVLAQQAADVIERIPDQASATEYLTVANALERSENYSRSLELVDDALKIDTDPTTREGLLRLKGQVLFKRGDAALGRAALKEALGVWPSQPTWQQARGNAFTELLWSGLEARAGQCQEANTHLSRAQAQAKRLDPDSAIGIQVARSVDAANIRCK
jgi:tetratricopeptide (TPR) repeat protein